MKAIFVNIIRLSIKFYWLFTEIVDGDTRRYLSVDMLSIMRVCGRHRASKSVWSEYVGIIMAMLARCFVSLLNQWISSDGYTYWKYWMNLICNLKGSTLAVAICWLTLISIDHFFLSIIKRNQFDFLVIAIMINQIF